MNGKSENNVTAREAAHFRQGQLVHGGNVLANRSTKYLHTRSTMSLVPTVYYANLRPTFSLSLSLFTLFHLPLRRFSPKSIVERVP